MATAVIMPQVGQDIKTGVIVEWRVKENDYINKGDVVAVVESDKATFDVEAYESGVLLKILYDAGAEVNVLEPIAYLGEPGEKIADLKQPATANLETPETNLCRQAKVERATKRNESSAIAASPSAKRLAREYGIDLTTIRGTGPDGRIVKQDVLDAMSAKDDDTS